MYVWRIPLPFFAAVVASAVLALTWIGVASIHRRVKAAPLRGVLLGIAIIATLLSPCLVHSITVEELEQMAKLGSYVHFSSYIYLSPAFVVALLFVTNKLAFPDRDRSTPARWHLTFWLIAFAFIALNVVNWCRPGWCEHFGFPFPYRWWSDARTTINGENLTEGTSLVALCANGALLLVAIAALGRAYRRALNGSGSVTTDASQ